MGGVRPGLSVNGSIFQRFWPHHPNLEVKLYDRTEIGHSRYVPAPFSVRTASLHVNGVYFGQQQVLWCKVHCY